MDNAHELVLEFIDLVSERGQFDLLAGAKVSFDADAVLVSGDKDECSPCVEQDILRPRLKS